MAGSWLSQIFHALADGVIGKVPEKHDDGATNPIHAALDSVTTAAAAVGSTATGIAQTEVATVVTKYAGGMTGAVAVVLLEALQAEVASRLTAAQQA